MGYTAPTNTTELSAADRLILESNNLSSENAIEQLKLIKMHLSLLTDVELHTGDAD